MFNLKEKLGKLTGKKETKDTAVTGPVPNLPKTGAQAPVYSFQENHISVQYTGDKDILQFLVAAAKASKHKRTNGQDPDETPFFNLANVIHGSFNCAMIEDKNLSEFLKGINALGVSGADRLYFYLTDFIAHADAKGNLTYSISGIFQKDDFRPVIIFWPAADSIWVNSLIKNKNIKVFKEGSGFVAQEKVKQEADDTIAKPEFEGEIEEYQIETTLLQVIEYCLNIQLVTAEPTEKAKDSVRQKLKDFKEESENMSSYSNMFGGG